MMHRRTSLTFATALLAAAVLAGCTPTPEPTPTPTALFASEDEAYAAAEATVRAYVDATNAARAGDESVDPLDWLTGTALQDSLDAAESQSSRGVHLTGPSTITTIEPVSYDAESVPVVIAVHLCLDVSETRVIDESGADITSNDRIVDVPLLLTVHASADASEIAKFQNATDFTC